MATTQKMLSPIKGLKSLLNRHSKVNTTIIMGSILIFPIAKKDH